MQTKRAVYLRMQKVSIVSVCTAMRDICPIGGGCNPTQTYGCQQHRPNTGYMET